MLGSFGGNVAAILYFLLYQFCGLMLAERFLQTEKKTLRLLVGSVLGSVLLQWMPVLFAFVLDFTRMGHVAAAILTVVAILLLRRKEHPLTTEKAAPEWKYAVLPMTVWCVFAYLVISGFEIRDGAVYSSQATYGDMAMHLGFITSIAEQQTFPPEYSILPGTRLSYPFLSDSISSSLYVWGCDIRLAYMLPMLFAGAQVMLGSWMLFETWLNSKGKSLLAWVLFFLNGGFGFVYFLKGDFSEQMNRLFTGFYQTPTNLTEENIRWVNMIVDMLLPQRATLFGYAVLFTALTLLFRAVWQKETCLFPAVGVLAGALPMIHTHSFLALVLVSGCWLLMWLMRECEIDRMKLIKLLPVAGILVMQALQIVIELTDQRQTDTLLLLLLVFAGVFCVALFVCGYRYVTERGFMTLLPNWGVYLVIAGCLAVPQLVIWTFGQATGEGFLRGYFNWANIDDNYIWFYIKNIGIVWLLFVPAYLMAGKKTVAVAFPVTVIFLIAELAVFQPNVYDNNKLLYVAYLLMCGVTADFMIELYRRMRSVPLKNTAAVLTVFLCTVSAALTIGRECVAEYQLIGPDQYKLGEYVMENTEPDDKFLTDTRHNNVIAALTGRNIQCGSGSYVYYHGLDYYEQEQAIRVMYEEPAWYPETFALYDIDYIVVSAYERNNYQVDETTIASMFPCVYDTDGVRVYQVK
ncbi:MAG: hypothetical protein IJA67_02815 [Oscillospiraceae bacterium]|nr:hypothetical protein [Oscillospiraceae bacterium]